MVTEIRGKNLAVGCILYTVAEEGFFGCGDEVMEFAMVSICTGGCAWYRKQS